MAITVRAQYKGKTYNRRTDRTYTHAIGCTLGPGRSRPGDECIAAWCGSAELAAKTLRRYSAPSFGFSHLEIVEVLS